MKFVVSEGRVIADRSAMGVGPGSYVITSRVAEFYDVVLRSLDGGILVDLGAGSAPLRVAYDQFVDSSIRLDWPASAHGGEALDVIANLTDGLPLRPQSVDIALLSDVLEHLPEPRRTLGAIAEVLVPGGVLVGNVPFMYWLHEEPHDYYRYTRYGLVHVLTAAGFVDVVVEEVGGASDVVVDLASKAVGRRLPRRLLTRVQHAYLSSSASTGVLGALNRGRWRDKVPLGYGFCARMPRAGSSSRSHFP